MVNSLLSERPFDRLRSVQAILRLEETVGAQRLEAACARAVYFGDFRYRRIKDILNAAMDREPLPETTVVQPTTTHTFARTTADFFSAVQHDRPSLIQGEKAPSHKQDSKSNPVPTAVFPAVFQSHVAAFLFPPF